MNEPLRPEDILPDVRLTVGGVIRLGDRGFIHAEAFRDMFGEAAYEEVIHRPRVVCGYDEGEEVD